MKKQLLLLAMILLPVVANAYDFAAENADGVIIYYNYTNDGKELEVTKGDYNSTYSGALNIPETVTYMGRKRSVTSIGESAFMGSYLSSVTIPNSVISIGYEAFWGCSDLSSVIMPNSIRNIEGRAFQDCNSLTTIVLGNNLESIGQSAFAGCGRLKSITIPNSVTSIGFAAFFCCSSLTSITIPNSVKFIGNSAFACVDLSDVRTEITEPYEINSDTFSDNTFYNVTLRVPHGTLEKYKATGGWSKFTYIEEIGEGGIQICAKPTISYNSGKLTYHCETEGATCQYNITDNDIKAGSGNEVQLAVTYNISVYATKSGYDNSETATATLCWIDKEPTTEGITDGVTQIASKAALIQSEGGILKVEGVDDGTQVAVYTPDGKQAGSAVSRNGAALVGTSIQPGNTAIVKIGEKAVKIIVK